MGGGGGGNARGGGLAGRDRWMARGVWVDAERGLVTRVEAEAEEAGGGGGERQGF